MSLKCIASVLSLAFACSSQLASADMVPIDRRLLMETFGSVPEEEHFDAEAFYAQLGSQLLASSGEPPPGDYTVQVHILAAVFSSTVLNSVLCLVSC